MVVQHWLKTCTHHGDRHAEFDVVRVARHREPLILNVDLTLEDASGPCQAGTTHGVVAQDALGLAPMRVLRGFDAGGAKVNGDVVQAIGHCDLPVDGLWASVGVRATVAIPVEVIYAGREDVWINTGFEEGDQLLLSQVDSAVPGMAVRVAATGSGASAP